MAKKKKESFVDILIRRGSLSLDQASEASQMAREAGISVQDALLKVGYARSDEVMRAVAEEHDLEYVDLNEITIPDNVIEMVPESVARENVILPMAEFDGSLKIILSDPRDVKTMENLTFILNRSVSPALAPRENILEAINRYYGQIEGESADSMLQEFTDTAIDFTETTDDDLSSGEVVDENSAPLVRLVHMMISEAVQRRASDIHVEPFEERVRIRYRIDGVLHERDNVPRRLLGALVSRIKILAKLDIAERRRPQDGRIKVTVGEKELDLRVSTIPTNHGQSVVMRLLDKDNIKISTRQLGLSERDYDRFQGLIKRPNGIILVTGPTGSGKTTTLYASLNALNRPDRKIITAEDPVEYYLPGINQVEIRHDIGLDFARVIKAMLRQAPNIILVGEMRDQETASMGIQASLTGHLVLSTLHTNDAPSAVTRMIDIGVPGYLVASSVIAIMAQRLVRTICPKCKVPYTPKESVLAEAGIPPELAAKASFARGKGCGNCQKKGYRGRLGIYELLMVTSKIRELIFDDADTAEIRKMAISQGMSTLYADGMDKVMRGITSFEEVYRVAKKTEQDDMALQAMFARN
ncbi:GspE/PulE family protein [Lignipirellula cremea]|uniref:Type II/IV secretion system protein n=1 Tax=Lignipirellula cremea TaxID=2528010 RepID=A0A518DMJ0_9BACT|nr:GspE/PulE family protein [Lignipirellula cremea]QDU93031.1 Type II/IV secretion system protein [Lignipirellula cremea]